MGISYKTYVGPYVRCTFQQVKATRERTGCTNTACKNWGEGRGAFCSRCGAPIGAVSYEVLEPSVDRWEVSEAIDETLSDPGGDGYLNWAEANHAHLWLPNVDAGIERDGHLEERTDFALADLDLNQPAKESAQFIIFFEKELALFRERYGRDAVSVRWGIIQHYY